MHLFLIMPDFCYLLGYCAYYSPSKIGHYISHVGGSLLKIGGLLSYEPKNRTFLSAVPNNHTYSQLVYSDCAYSRQTKVRVVKGKLGSSKQKHEMHAYTIGA